MLRLWPEQQSLFLFPECGWWTCGTVRRDAQPVVGTHLQQFDLMAQQLLSETAARRGPRASLDVIVGGDVCRLRMVPWQPRLRNTVEQRRYAEVCFDSEGVNSDQWIVHAGYRHFGAAGLAVAVRRELLASMTALAATRALRLRQALPLAALAHWRHQPPRRGNEMLLLDEGKLLTAMCYSDRRLNLLDVQPIGQDRRLALTQLIRRCQVATRDVSHLSYLSMHPAGLDQTLLTAAWPTASSKPLTLEAWQ